MMQRVRQPFNVNAPAQWGALAALDDAGHIKRTLEANREGMEYLAREIDKLGLKRVASDANFILVRVGDGRAVFEKLLRRGVIVRPMGAYDLPDYVRVTVGTMRENQRFIEELNTVVKDKK